MSLSVKIEQCSSRVPDIFIAKHSHQAFLMSIEQIRVSPRETSHEVHHEGTSREATPHFSTWVQVGIMALVKNGFPSLWIVMLLMG